MATPKVDIWMPIYIGDYLRDTQELKSPEHGAYFLLLLHYWQKRGEIGSDIERLATVCKSSVETCRFILENYFELVDGNYRNKRSDIELRAANSRSEAARSNVMKRWNKNSNTREDTPVLPPYNDSNTESIRNRYSSSSPSYKDTSTNNIEYVPKKVFSKPTQQEVNEYFISEKLNGTPSEFFDYNEASGWKVGTKPMKDWKAAARNWSRNEIKFRRGRLGLRIDNQKTMLDMEG